MSRVTYAVPSRKRRKRTLERAKGFYGNASKNIRTVYDAVDKAGVHSYKGRKQKKQQYHCQQPSHLFASLSHSHTVPIPSSCPLIYTTYDVL